MELVILLFCSFSQKRLYGCTNVKINYGISLFMIDQTLSMIYLKRIDFSKNGRTCKRYNIIYLHHCVTQVSSCDVYDFDQNLYYSGGRASGEEKERIHPQRVWYSMSQNVCQPSSPYDMPRTLSRRILLSLQPCLQRYTLHREGTVHMHSREENLQAR